MKYQITRTKIGKPESGLHFKENIAEVELGYDLMSCVIVGFPFFFDASKGNQSRHIRTSRVVKVNRDNEDIIIFNTKSGSSYEIRRLSK